MRYKKDWMKVYMQKDPLWHRSMGKVSKSYESLCNSHIWKEFLELLAACNYQTWSCVWK